MYEDIINLPHHESLRHPKMTLENRCAQFMPFAALTGFSDEIKNEARTTNKKIELDEEYKEILDEKISLIEQDLKEEVKITYFVKDKLKDGGKYQEKIGFIKKVDKVNKIIVMQDKTMVKIDDILDIENEEINIFN